MMRRNRSASGGVASSVAAFLGDETGGAAVLLALTLPVVVGGLALGTEAGYWFLSQRNLQQAADLAAHAAGVVKRSGGSVEAMRTAAVRVASASGFDASSGSLTVNSPPVSGSRSGDSDSVEIQVRKQQKRFFTLIYASDPVPIGARAVAALGGGSSACLLALSASASGAVTVSGSAVVSFDGCDVASNSVASDSFLMSSGTSVLTTGCVNTVGGVIATAGLTLTECTTVQENAPPAVDPYADIAEPDRTGSCRNGNVGSPSSTVTLSPTDVHASGMPAMRFCSGLTLSGTVNLDPGLYIIEGGTFRINSNARVSGSGVTFYMANGAKAAFNGTASLDLSAPSSGPYTGVLIFGSRDATGVQHRVNGTAGSTLDGAVYTPASAIDFTGDFSQAGNGCVQLVASTISFSGNSSLSVSCQATPTRPIKVRQTVKLVE